MSSQIKCQPVQTLYIYLLFLFFLDTLTVTNENGFTPTKQDGVPTSVSEASPVTDDDIWMRLQHQRLQRINEVCERHELRPEPDFTLEKQLKTTLLSQWEAFYWNFMVDDKHKVLYCFIPKVACTSWKTVLLELQTEKQINGSVKGSVHNQPFMNRHGLRRLSTYGLEDVKLRLEAYTKFMFVRHPLERIASAYHDKIEHGLNREFKSYIKQAIATYRNDSTVEHRVDAEMDEFIRLFTDETLPRHQRWNAHWTPYHDSCHPCITNYDYVGHMETINDDAKQILLHVFNTTTVKFPHHNAVRSDDRYLKDFESVPEHIMAKLHREFLLDFEMFNYKWNG